MSRNTRLWTTIFVLAMVPALAHGAEQLTYAEEDGSIKTVQVESVTKVTDKEWKGLIDVGGRRKAFTVPIRRIVSFRRGDASEINQWSKLLAQGRRLYAAGQLATQGVVPGAEETFAKIAYSTEKGTRGQEDTERIETWHNMYATLYLIETRLEMGRKGDGTKLASALGAIQEFRTRTQSKPPKEITVQVVDPKGLQRAQNVWCWGENPLVADVDLLEARVLAAQGQADAAKGVLDKLIDEAKKGALSPNILTDAIILKSEVEASGKASEEQETIFRSAGVNLSSLARNQPDLFGKKLLSRASNMMLLRGADLLLASADQQKSTYDPPLARYTELRQTEGKSDPALAIGATAGIGICLTEKGQGEAGYRALLEVVTQGYEYPEQMARALYYLGKAAPVFAKEIDAQGGDGSFLRAEAARWWADLRERYPTSDWAARAKA